VCRSSAFNAGATTGWSVIFLAKLSIRSPWAGAWIVVGIVLSVRARVYDKYADVFDRLNISAGEESR